MGFCIPREFSIGLMSISSSDATISFSYDTYWPNDSAYLDIKRIIKIVLEDFLVKDKFYE